MAYHAHHDRENVHPRRAHISPIALKKLDEADRYSLEVVELRIDRVRPTDD